MDKDDLKDFLMLMYSIIPEYLCKAMNEVRDKFFELYDIKNDDVKKEGNV